MSIQCSLLLRVVGQSRPPRGLSADMFSQLQHGLEGEVKIVDSLQEGEPWQAGRSLDAGLLMVDHFLKKHLGAEVALRPALGLGP